MSNQLTGKVALVTGAAGGLGQAIVQAYLAEGARVVAFDRDAQALANAFDTTDVVCIAGDVRSVVDNQNAVQRALEHFGKLDILVANAGIYDNRKPLASFNATDLPAAFDELFAINVMGYFLAAHAAADALTRSKGCIIFTSSVSGNHAGFGGALYVAAKHAINGLTKQLALELAPHVRVNAVAPGFIPTGLRGLDTLSQGVNPVAPTAAQMPLNTIASPRDYATAYVFLATDAAAHMASGSIMALDGGSAIRGPRP